MESKELEILAERFWQGETSEAEESSLREAVLYGQIPEALEELREYFQMTQELKETETLGDVFDQQILHELEKRDTRTSSFFFFKLAAGIALVVGMFFLVKTLTDEPETFPLEDELVIVDTYDDPEVAYQEVKKALLLVSKNMNQGLSYTGNLGEFDKATDRIEKESKGDRSSQ